MKVKMYMRPDQFKFYRQKRAAFASTFRDHESCFEIEVDANQIDLDQSVSGLPTNNYFIDQTK